MEMKSILQKYKLETIYISYLSRGTTTIIMALKYLVNLVWKLKLSLQDYELSMA